MNPLEAEALDYPSAHRDRARELLRQREALSAALAGLPSHEVLHKPSRWALITAFGVIPLALLTTIGSMIGLIPKQPANIFSLTLVVCSFIVFIVVARTEQKRLRRERLEFARDKTLAELDKIRDDYTGTEGERSDADFAVALLLEPDPRETSNKVVLVAATIALLGTLGVLVWELSKAFMA